jgi:hypothetical protein
VDGAWSARLHPIRLVRTPPYALRGASGAMGARTTSAVSSESGSSDAAMIASSMALTVPATEVALEGKAIPRGQLTSLRLGRRPVLRPEVRRDLVQDIHDAQGGGPARQLARRPQSVALVRIRLLARMALGGGHQLPARAEVPVDGHAGDAAAGGDLVDRGPRIVP